MIHTHPTPRVAFSPTRRDRRLWLSAKKTNYAKFG